jgi:hypothetical protein
MLVALLMAPPSPGTFATFTTLALATAAYTAYGLATNTFAPAWFYAAFAASVVAFRLDTRWGSWSSKMSTRRKFMIRHEAALRRGTPRPPSAACGAAPGPAPAKPPSTAASTSTPPSSWPSSRPGNVRGRRSP